MRIYNLPKCGKCDLRFNCPMHYNMFELRDISKKFELYSIVKAITVPYAYDVGNKCLYCRHGTSVAIREVIMMNVMIEALKDAHRDAIDGAIFESQERLRHARV